LELVHSDVCVPMPSTSLSRYVYYVSFIDDYSHKTWVYFLKSKDEVLGKFKEFKDLVDVKFGSIDSHSPMRGHMGHPEASQGDLENQPVL
jgi:hypothetical protein